MYAFGKQNCILVGTLQLFESGAETEFFPTRRHKFDENRINLTIF